MSTATNTMNITKSTITGKILLDTREIHLKQAIDVQDDPITYTVDRLPIGDIQMIYYENDNPVYTMIIERKTNRDLLASFRDTRYKEQKKRLLKTGANQIIYIIETRGTNILYEEGVMGAILSMTLRDNIKVFTTNTLRDTAYLVRILYKKIILLLTRNALNRREDMQQEGGIECVISNFKRQKRDFRGSHDIFINALIAYDGISTVRATKLALHFGTFNNIFNIISQIPDREEKINYFCTNGLLSRHIAWKFLIDLGIIEHIDI